jgi:hypothetical protein
MHKMLAAVVISVFVVPAGAFAQSPASDESGDRTIRVAAFRLPAGFMRTAVSDDFRLTTRPLAQQQTQKRSWPGRHPVLFGALLGLGIGLGVEAAVIPGASGGEPHGVYVPMFGGIGAGIGSLVGVVVSVARR